MNCPKCGVEAAIMASRVEVIGDDSPEKQTEVYQVLVYQCRNPQCDCFERDIGEEKIRTYPETGEEVNGHEQG